MLAQGDFRVDLADGGRLVYSRWGDGERITVAVNATDTPMEYPLVGEWIDLLSGDLYRGQIAPFSAVILSDDIKKEEV